MQKHKHGKLTVWDTNLHVSHLNKYVKAENFLLVYVSRKLLKRQPADILNPEDNTGKRCISEYSILIAYRANN